MHILRWRHTVVEIESRVALDSTAAAVWRDLQEFFEHAQGDSIATDRRRNDEHALWLIWKKIIKTPWS